VSLGLRDALKERLELVVKEIGNWPVLKDMEFGSVMMTESLLVSIELVRQAIERDPIPPTVKDERREIDIGYGFTAMTWQLEESTLFWEEVTVEMMTELSEEVVGGVRMPLTLKVTSVGGEILEENALAM
jgi:hypothetical protein